MCPDGLTDTPKNHTQEELMVMENSHKLPGVQQNDHEGATVQACRHKFFSSDRSMGWPIFFFKKSTITVLSSASAKGRGLYWP